MATVINMVRIINIIRVIRSVSLRDKPTWVYILDWVVPTVQVPIDTLYVSNRVGLHKPADVRIIISRAVIVKSCFDIESAAGEHVGIGKEVGI